MRVTSLLNSGADVETRSPKVCYIPTMVVCSSDYGVVVSCHWNTTELLYCSVWTYVDWWVEP